MLHFEYSNRLAGGDEYETAFDRAYQEIKQLLLFGMLAPGVQINIRKMADQLRVSPTPIREALIKLSVEDVIVLEANKGFFTKPISIGDITAHAEMALLILSYALTKNPVQSSDVVQKAIGTFCSIATGPGGVEQCVRCQSDIYEQIAALTGNPKAVGTIQRFNERSAFVRLIDCEQTHRREQLNASMHGVLNALAGAAPSQAHADIQLQFEHFLDHLPGLVKEGNARAIMQHGR